MMMLRGDANIRISTSSTATVDSAEIRVRSPLMRRSASTAIGATPACCSARPPPACRFTSSNARRISASSGRCALPSSAEWRDADEDDGVAMVRRDELIAVDLQRSGARAFEPAQDRGEPPERIRRRQAREHRPHRRRHLLLESARGPVQPGVGEQGRDLGVGLIRHEVGEALRVQLVHGLGERRGRPAFQPGHLGVRRQPRRQRRGGGLDRLRIGSAHVEDQRARQRRIGELARQIGQTMIGAGGQEVRDVVVHAQAQGAEDQHPDRGDGGDPQLQPRAVALARTPGHFRSFLGSVKNFACSAGV